MINEIKDVIHLKFYTKQKLIELEVSVRYKINQKYCFKSEDIQHLVIVANKFNLELVFENFENYYYEKELLKFWKAKEVLFFNTRIIKTDVSLYARIKEEALYL